jgi:hypothetical protein
MPCKDPEKRRLYMRKYTREWRRKKYAEDPARFRKYDLDWRQRHPERYREIQRAAAKRYIARRLKEDPDFIRKRSEKQRRQRAKDRLWLDLISVGAAVSK